MNRSKFKSNLFLTNESNFDSVALELFHFQRKNNSVYKKYLDVLEVDQGAISQVVDIPFLPIQLFKGNKILCEGIEYDKVFESSGTTSKNTSKHYVNDLEFYLHVAKETYESFYEPLKDSIVIGLLPSYLERDNSSLVYMVDHFIKVTKNELSGFYLDQYDELIRVLNIAKNTDRNVLLIGVSFGLLDFAEENRIDLSDVIVMETGGMKGRRDELTRDELHNIFKKSFGVHTVHSEYGMTELLSQAYSKGEGVFQTPPWMKVSFRPLTDPFGKEENRAGVLKVIDLANIDSCAFIETQDLGRCIDGGFEVLGRIDNSDTRGCNLLI